MFINSFSKYDPDRGQYRLTFDKDRWAGSQIFQYGQKITESTMDGARFE